MSDYVKSTNFTAKDSLPSGDSNKIIRGSEHDTEYSAIATAIATKYDSADLASQAQAEGGTLDTVLMTPLRVQQALDANAEDATFTPTGSILATTIATAIAELDGDVTSLSSSKANVANPTFTGSITIGSASVDETELEILDGATVTTSELNILDGVTATTAELNKMDGVTATTTEINYIDGVTSALQAQLNAKAPLASPTFTGTVTLPSTTSVGSVSSTELGYLNGVTSAIQTQLNALGDENSSTNGGQDGSEVFIETDTSRVITIKWGRGTSGGAGLDLTVTFASLGLSNFANSQYAVATLGSNAFDTNQWMKTGPSTTGFTIGQNGGTTIYWIAVGFHST